MLIHRMTLTACGVHVRMKSNDAIDVVYSVADFNNTVQFWRIIDDWLHVAESQWTDGSVSPINQ